ncbi:MFS transporter [Granulicella tundricola]|uniref:Major facilitator superfamily MFS_1 n=1 Tax=Granulicella tundricola (strain ATCC BAA-1859 / DSM 23138 / MP5ACTX9) TaxID=1198114 RepID=E8X6F9_GRATM|nr:MFS transporter [Granulicella tundricola]ADW71043.1 major facilitator superfamily MFS_1 [Granulicella tundricola MP5ACTX9]
MSTPVISSNRPVSHLPAVKLRPADEPWIFAFLAGISGWTLDAFDFFLVVLSLTAIGHEFNQDVKHMTLALTATLALRPVGAFLFGGISDRFGRRLPLVANLCLFAVVELSTAFAHSFLSFLIVRAVFGIVMGGQWGVGVSLAMEKVPARLRGVLSGLLQQGYSIGFLLAAAAYYVIQPVHGWRPLFYLGSIPALAAAAMVVWKVRESDVWLRNRQSSFAGLGRDLMSHWKLFLYLTFFMMAMHMSSHGTQDLYPTFLERDWGIAGRQKAALTAISMGGAVLGGLSIGWISDRVGRRTAMVGALIGAVCSIPLWAFAHTLPLLILGAVLMQFCVQGAWGVVPAHVAEMSPDSVRGTLPGLGNQVGVLLSSVVVYLEAALAKGRSYAVSMSITAAVVFCLAALLTLSGRERRSDGLAKLE